MEPGYYSIDYLRTFNGVDFYSLYIDNIRYEIQEVPEGILVAPEPPAFIGNAIQDAFHRKRSGETDKYNIAFVIR